MFAIDVRALAVFRVGVSLLLLVDLFFRSLSLTAHYTDLGLLPRDVANDYAGGVVGSLYMIGGSGWFVAVLFGIAAILALMLLVGFETLLSTFGCWAMLVSLHSRNTSLLNGGDLLLCLLLCWSIFLPLGACASVDRWRRRRPLSMSQNVLSVGTVAVLVQVILVYLCTGLKKIDPVWCTEGTAFYYALNIDQFVTTIGRVALQLPESVLRGASIATFWWEVAGWVFLFVPFWWARFRVGAVFLFMLLHVGIALTLHVGLFSLVCIVAWTLFLPTGFWDWAQETAPGRRAHEAFAWLLGRLTGRRNRDAESTPVAAGTGVGSEEGSTSKQGAMDTWVVGIMLAFVLWSNVGGFVESLKVPKGIANVAEALRLNQDWAMFSPRPPSYDGWFVAPAMLEDSSEVDLYSLVDGSSTSVDWAKPEHPAAAFPDQRWRKYMTNIWLLEKYRKHAEHFGNYLRRTWNAAQPPEKQVVSMSISIMVEYTMPPYQEPLMSRELLYEWYGDEDFRVISHPESMENIERKKQQREAGGGAVRLESALP